MMILSDEQAANQRPQRQTKAPTGSHGGHKQAAAAEGQMQLTHRGACESRRRRPKSSARSPTCEQRPRQHSISALPIRLLLLVCVISTALAHSGKRDAIQGRRHRLATRSSILSEDEEELTIGQQLHQSLGESATEQPQPPQLRSAGGDLWPQSLEHRRQQEPRLTRKRENEVFDPFVSVFDDYLREASGRQSGDSAELDNQVGPPPQAPALTPPNAASTQLVEDEEPGRDSNELPSAATRRQIVVENEDDDKQAPASLSSDSQPPAASRQRPELEPGQAAASSGGGSPASAELRLNEIKLLFAWRSLPTNKCSRPCGKGQRLNHLSCIDFKYNVRVEDELCQRANLARPSELGDESCNEHDCEPKWHELEFQQCDPAAGGGHQSEVCRPKLFKRLECAMVNRLGHTVHLDESRCNAADAPSSGERAPHEDPSGQMDSEFSIDLGDSADGSVLSNELPSFVASGRPASNLETGEPDEARTRTASVRSSEPFYEPGEWGECAGAPCGQLGRRRRRLTCRLFLARSSKFVDLPDSSCSAGHLQLDREQPCYMDCGPASAAAEAPRPLDQPSLSPRYSLVASEGRTTNELSNKAAELEEETIYDLQVARYVWRHGAWTKCSLECLGGASESVVECWDKVADLSVDLKHCDAHSRPKPLTRTCNEVACPPEWHVGPFSNCSAACGSAGLRVRDVLCVQRVPIRSELNREERTSYQMLVPIEQCEQQQRLNGSLAHVDASNSTKPHPIEPCNRHDCKPEWQVGPWGECQGAVACQHGGHRNRTVVCVQEFASAEGPASVQKTANGTKPASPDLLEAVQLAASAWHPGKAVQVPFSECYREFHSVPQLTEECPAQLGLCRSVAATQQQQLDRRESVFIDSDPMQDFRMVSSEGQLLPAAAARRRTIALKVGGRAQLLEGRNLKIRCRLLRKSHVHQDHHHATLVKQRAVEWRKDGVRVFAPNTTMADKQPILAHDQEPDMSDNSILGYGPSEDLPLADKYSMMAPDPQHSDTRRPGPRADGGGGQRTGRHKLGRALRVRSWPTAGVDVDSFQFVPQAGGRFSLVKENTLRIKRLKLDDSGVYTCTYGLGLSESIEITVVGRRRGHSKAQQHANNDQPSQQQNSLL